MKVYVEVAFACLLAFILLPCGYCDQLSTTPGIKNWTCACSLSYPGNQSYVSSNCSQSCNCNQANGDMWTCMCPFDGLPRIADSSHDSTCFTACNCTIGSLTGLGTSPKKHMASRVLVIILLLCVILTTLAFVGSVTFYVYRREKFLVESPGFSSDRLASFSSRTHLISQRTCSTVSDYKGSSINCPTNSVSGCFGKASFLCGNKKDVVYGVISRFSYSELEYATDKFSNSNLIGCGGSSFVYRGLLRDGSRVAIKRLEAHKGPDFESVFSTEVELLSRLNHCHVVPLLGYCSEFQGKHSERLLVFEYMPNGNLRDSLDGSLGEKMTWEIRVMIAIGAARGLEYLHAAAAPRILHRDVKSTNILLDEGWRAKITDLGMAKCLRGDDAPSSSSSPARMQGTFGYFAPEYAMIGRASLMSDVFSFGVVLLELITGRQPIHKTQNKGEESLVFWATPRLLDSRRVISELPDPRLNGNFPEEEMHIMAYLAKECLLLDPDARPTMSEVVQILSTMAPDKSSRRNIPVSLYQMPSTDSLRSEPSFIDKTELVNEVPFDSTEAKLTSRQSSERNVDHDHEPAIDVVITEAASRVSDANNKPDTVSAEYMERLVRLTSNARASEDEVVDITEPRFESFRVANMKSPPR
ncbi:Receptor-like serine/threonine-protein kinase NCRK [Linum grandiflorum]